jgi:hypothetical protein
MRAAGRRTLTRPRTSVRRAPARPGFGCPHSSLPLKPGRGVATWAGSCRRSRAPAGGKRLTGLSPTPSPIRLRFGLERRSQGYPSSSETSRSVSKGTFGSPARSGPRRRGEATPRRRRPGQRGSCEGQAQGVLAARVGGRRSSPLARSCAISSRATRSPLQDVARIDALAFVLGEFTGNDEINVPVPNVTVASSASRKRGTPTFQTRVSVG